MQKLTKKEEEIMQVVWKLEKAFVKEIIAEMPEPKPHYNTIATIIRILEDKGFMAHESLGNSFRYHAIISKEDYQQRALGDVLSNYFDDSPMKLVTYFAKQEKLDKDQLKKLIKIIKDKKS